MKKIYKELEEFSGFFPNISFFLSSHFISYFFSFFIIIFLARQYSADLFGKFTVAQTIFFIIYSISFSNIHYYLNKSLSLKFHDRKKNIASCFLITFYSSVALYILLLIIVAILDIDSDLKNTIILINLILLSQPFAIFHSELFVRGQFYTIFKTRFLQNLIFFPIKFMIIFFKFNIGYLALAYFFENLFFSVCMIYYFIKNGNSFKKLIVSKIHILKIFKKIILFPLLALSFLVSLRIDILMISTLLDEESSGYYSAATRIITIILLFGTHFFQFIYPNLNRINNKKEKFIKIYNRIILLSLLVGFLCFLMSIIFGSFYLNLYGEKFLVAINSLIILSINISFALLINAWIYKNYINAKYKTILFFQASAITINILLNYYLVSNFGIDGAAMATIISGLISFLIVNIYQPNEFAIILSSFTSDKIKAATKDMLRIILTKKNPDKDEKIND